jgi:hypothetical protein
VCPVVDVRGVFGVRCRGVHAVRASKLAVGWSLALSVIANLEFDWWDVVDHPFRRPSNADPRITTRSYVTVWQPLFEKRVVVWSHFEPSRRGHFELPSRTYSASLWSGSCCGPMVMGPPPTSAWWRRTLKFPELGN